MVHWGGIQLQVADTLSCLPRTHIDKSQLKDDVLVLRTMEKKPGVKDRNGFKNLQKNCLLSSKGHSRARFPNVLEMLDGTDKEKPYTTSKFVTDQANDLGVEKLPIL